MSNQPEAPPNGKWEIVPADNDEFEIVDRRGWGGMGAKIKKRFEQLSKAKQKWVLDRFLRKCNRDQDGFYWCNCNGFEVMFYLLEPKSAIMIVSVAGDPNPTRH